MPVSRGCIFERFICFVPAMYPFGPFHNHPVVSEDNVLNDTSPPLQSNADADCCHTELFIFTSGLICVLSTKQLIHAGFTQFMVTELGLNEVYEPSNILNSEKPALFVLLVPPVIVIRIYLAIILKLSVMIWRVLVLPVLSAANNQFVLSEDASILYL